MTEQVHENVASFKVVRKEVQQAGQVPVLQDDPFRRAFYLEVGGVRHVLPLRNVMLSLPEERRAFRTPESRQQWCLERG